MSNVVIFKMRDGNDWVGVVEDRTPDMGWLCSSVAVIRAWGTSSGLFELCGGPQPTTIIDGAVQMPEGTLAEVPRGNVIGVVPAQSEPWLALLEQRNAAEQAPRKKR